jgi:hypothetical protein
MAVILNASTSSGFVQSADTSGVITLQNNGTSALSVNSGNLQFNSGYGSVATAYGCRAWVNFNGTGTVAIRASGNVSSITDNGTGDYTVNFTNAMPDENFSVAALAMRNSSTAGTSQAVVPSLPGSPSDYSLAFSTTRVNLYTKTSGSVAFADCLAVTVVVFR